ncbi:MAG: hypothetical protein DWQ01_00215 [Planctomycetota bacterium]|nr:MAG: hypothetical protein DWQ01_00215 [Planctomycetota bacterium]
MNYLLRTIVLAAITGVVVWWTAFWNDRLQEHERELEQRDQQIQVLEDEVLEKEKQIEELETAIQLLKIDHRVARIEVLRQDPAPDGEDEIDTTLRFQELGPDGEPLGPGRILTIRGSRAYVEALVIKFGDEFVEQGDALKGSSICLFRRIFGEAQSPQDGEELDAYGARPLPYSPEREESPPGDQVWEKFWDYANQPKAAEALGIRAIHGEAPFMELRPGKSYRLELRASDGLSIITER